MTLLDILAETGSRYCLIWDLAVNAYVEPVVSLDLDIVVTVQDVEATAKEARNRGLAVEQFKHSVKLSSDASELRIPLHTDPRYQAFIADSEIRGVLGYKIKVVKLEDVLRGKTWAYMDKERRRSKRQKDLADILRIIEAHPELKAALPQALRDEVERQ